ncbi:MAG: hypothetical protein V2I41_21115 [Pseudomonadales bacterium]|jgi:hypothetical protein|nr:hypothetical protein [Pseudomonadales bacterium]
MRIWVWIVRSLFGVGALLVAGIAALLIYQRISDGPTELLPGGPFTSGTVLSAPVTDWSLLEGDFEFELVGERTSRSAGGLLLDGNLYISCDLGFIWSRLPEGLGRNVMHVIWWFKTWHGKALIDGRVRIRKDGNIYPVTIERVTNPQLLERLKATIEFEAEKFFAPNELGPRPVDPPNDIWFFRVRQ